MYPTHFKNQKEVIIYSKNSKIDLCIDVLFIKRIRRDEKVLRSAWRESGKKSIPSLGFSDAVAVDNTTVSP